MSKLFPVAVGVCAAGAVSSVALLLLDIRTHALVQVAERALLTMEDETFRTVPLLVLRNLEAEMRTHP